MTEVEIRDSEDDAELVLMTQGASDEEIRNIVQQAKEYYYQHNTANNSATYQSPKANQNEVRPESTESYPASFNAIVEMIATGQDDKIPGIRDIPLKINEEPPSVSALPRPKKPWETSP